ncbi:1131_t:CDS:2, partial [Paraglomus occultum]
ARSEPISWASRPDEKIEEFLKTRNVTDLEDITAIIYNLRNLSERHGKRSAEEQLQQQYLKKLERLPGPSELGKTYTQSDENPTFLNHRPPSAEGIPTELLHPVFGQFLDDCASAQPTMDDVQFAVSFSTSMLRYYNSEGDRADRLRNLFADHYVIGLKGSTIRNAITDATWFPDSKSNFMAMNIEVKNEPGRNGDSFIQNIGYYQQYILSHERREMIRLPCFLISVVGPTLSISRAIFGARITIDAHPNTLSFACSSYNTEYFARIFRALKNAIETLREYYSNNIPDIEPEQREFPYLNSFQSGGSRIHFKYRRALNPHLLIFIVDIDVDVNDAPGLPQQLLVKFTRRYGVEAHRECASLGIAPELFGFEVLAGGWKAVVMAYKGDDFKTLLECTFDEKIKTAVKETAVKMHRKGFVHGDLRDVNILYHCQQARDRVDILFIDWDWAGKEGEARYPPTMNPKISRHQNAVAHQLIWKEHDDHMLDIMFR